MDTVIAPGAFGKPTVALLSKNQKLAVLLLMLDSDSAAEIIRRLPEEELLPVVQAMNELNLIDQDTQADVLREFTGVAVSAGAAISGGANQVQSLLEKGVGLFKASEIISRVSPSPPPVAAMEQLSEMEPRQILNLLRNEQPQIIALVICHLAPAKASQLLALMRTELREQVLLRIGSMQPTSIDALEKVIEVLQPKLANQQPRAQNQRGGVKMVAEVLNAMDKSVSKSILISIEEQHPELGQAIRQKMFTFDDLARLDNMALQMILREIDKRDLAVALKAASDRVQNSLLASMSRRAAESLMEEVNLLGPVKLKEVEAAQASILDTARRLESEGEIDLAAPQPQTPRFQMAR